MPQNINALPRAVKPTTQSELMKAALLGYLFYECFWVTAALFSDLQHHLKLTEAEINRYPIRSVPSEVQNIIASTECLRRYGPDALLASGMFYRFTRSGSVCTCFEYSDNCECDGETWRLDINPAYSGRGLLLPMVHPTRGYFTDIQVYRSVRDLTPFVLRVGADREVAA